METKKPRSEKNPFLTEGRRATVTGGLCSLYAESREGVLTDEALYGMSCCVLEETSLWARVRMDYGYTGWIQKNNLSFASWDERDSLLRVTRQHMDVLERPEVESVKRIDLPRGSVLARAEGFQETETEHPGWTAVKLLAKDGRVETGYTKKSFVEPYKPLCFENLRERASSGEISGEEESLIRERVAERALSYSGAPYRWGGKTPQGIDCSGLTAMAYLLEGFVIYRDAAIRPGYCMREIALSELKKADLLFFKGHVALYLGGERKLYVHSTAKALSDGVDINSLNEEDPLYREDLAKGILQVGSLF